MAYRQLNYGDHVRIVDGLLYHGMNAVVIDSQSNQLTYVQINVGRTDALEAQCVWVHTDKLLVLDDPSRFIYDGRFDYGAQQKRFAEIKKSLIEEEELEEACGECSCCHWHIEQNC